MHSAWCSKYVFASVRLPVQHCTHVREHGLCLECASCQERRKRTRLMKTASKLTQAELLEVMSLQVRIDERRKTKNSGLEDEEDGIPEAVASDDAADK